LRPEESWDYRASLSTGGHRAAGLFAATSSPERNLVRTAPVPNMAAIPGMNPGIFVLGGGGDGGGEGGEGGDGKGGKQGANGKNGGKNANGGGKNANGCGPGGGSGCPNPAHGNRGTAAGDPVDPVTGRVYTLAIADLSLSGPLPLFLKRSYSTSACEHDVGLGFGWMHSLAWSLFETRRTVRVVDPHGEPTVAPKPAMGEDVRLPCGVLRRYDGGYALDTGDKRVLVFRREDAVEGHHRLTRIFDPNGHAIVLFYGPAGLESILDSAGRTVRVRRGRDGRIAAFEVRNAAQQGSWVSFRSYVYDDEGNLTAALDADGHAERFTYDAEHRLLSRSTASGVLAEFRYDDGGRCVETWCRRTRGEDGLDADAPAVLADGKTPAKGFLHVKIDHYPDFCEVITSTSIRRIEGNAVGEVDKITWGGGVHTKTFDEAGALLAYEDGEGARWSFERDGVGQLTREVDPLGAVTEHEHDATGLLAKTRYPNGDEVRYGRDGSGNLLSIEDPAGQVAAFVRGPGGQLVEAIMPNGGVTRMRYDDQGNRVEVVEPDGARRLIRYDYLGRLQSFVDGRGFETSLSYDACGRLRSVRKPSGAARLYDYDEDGHLVRVTHGDGRFTELVRGGFHQVIAVVRQDGARVAYRYDREQRLVRIVNEAGEEHRFERDAEGRITAEHTFDGRTVRYDHDLDGRIVKIDHGGGEVTEVVYDKAGRLVERKHSEGWSEKYEYDEVGRMVAASNDQVECRFERDARGNIVRQTTTYDGETEAVEAGFGPICRRTDLRLPGGLAVRYALDPTGRPTAVEYGDAAPIRIAYDPTGAEVGRLLPGGGRVERAYDADGALVQLTVRGPLAARLPRAGEPMWVGRLRGDETLTQSFGWTAAQDLQWIEDAERGATQIELEIRGRVAETKAAKGPSEAFAYGPAGQLHDAGVGAPRRRYGAGGRIEQRGGVTYAYDARGRLIEKRAPGELGAEQRWTFEWGPHGQLSAVVGPGQRVDFTYDPFGRRVEKRVSRDGQLVATTRYTWDTGVVVRSVERRTGAAGALVEERDYLYVPGQLIASAQRVKRNGEAAPWHHVVTDANLRVPQALVNGDGTVAERLDISFLGRLEGAKAALTHLRYPGQIADPETGLHDNRHRAYDPETGLFLSPEPLGIEASLMTYAYANHEPHRAYDPDGLAVPSTVSGSAGTFSVGAGTAATNQPLHPAVAAALPNANARPLYPDDGSEHSMTQCGDPHAFSQYLFAWENQNGRRCDPATPQGQANLRDALQSINSFQSERTRNIPNPPPPQPFAPCPNCSQTISRLYGSAGLNPPGTPGSAEAPSPNGTNTTMRDGRRVDTSTGTYESPDPNSPLQQQPNAGNGPAMAQGNQGRYSQAVTAAQNNPNAQQWNQPATATNPAPNPAATPAAGGVYEHDNRDQTTGTPGDNHQGQWNRPF
jgi:RHS repeat-associated protein